MPRYFYDVDDNGQLLRDDEGTDLESDGAAHYEGLRAMAEMAKDSLPGSGPQSTLTMSVRDESGRIVSKNTLTFRSERL